MHQDAYEEWLAEPANDYQMHRIDLMMEYVEDTLTNAEAQKIGDILESALHRAWHDFVDVLTDPPQIQRRFLPGDPED